MHILGIQASESTCKVVAMLRPAHIPSMPYPALNPRIQARGRPRTQKNATFTAAPHDWRPHPRKIPAAAKLSFGYFTIPYTLFTVPHDWHPHLLKVPAAAKMCAEALHAVLQYSDANSDF